MQRLWCLIGTLVLISILTIVLQLRSLHEQTSIREVPAVAALTKRMPSASLPLGTAGFSFRSFTRDSLATFIVESAAGDAQLASFFYEKRPTLDMSSTASLRASLDQGLYFRLPGCVGKEMDPMPPTMDRIDALRQSAMAAAKAPHSLPSDLCLFSQMRPSKNLAVIALARRLNVTHIVESGRKGGSSAFIYAVLGMRVVSVELYPIPFISGALAQLAPEVRLLEGDGTRLVKAAIEEIHTADPRARVAVVLDGPKYMEAYKAFLNLRRDVVFAVFDDVYPDTEFRSKMLEKEAAIFLTDHPIWMASGFPARDAIKLGEQWPGDDSDPSSQFAEDWQTLAIVPGDGWVQWA